MSETSPDLIAELESLRAESSRQAIDAEEALHQLTNKLSDLESQLVESRLNEQVSMENVRVESERVKQLDALLVEEKNNSKAIESGGIEAKKRQEELERSTRDLVDACTRAEEEKATLEESLTNLRTLHTSLQNSHSSLESKLQESTTISRTSLLRLQTLSSTITSLEADKLFLTTELERGRLEWSEFRRESHVELVRIQTELENHATEEQNAKTSLASLKLSHDSLTTRHLDSVQSLSKVREELAASQNNFTNEMGSMKRLVEMMEGREAERIARVAEVERGLEDERSGRIEREVELMEELRVEKERSDSLELRCAEMRDALEGSATSYTGVYPHEEEQASPSIRGSFVLSPSAQMAVKSQKSGRSYAEVYGEYIRMQEDLLREKAETARLGDCLAQIMGDIEERAPLLKEQRSEYDRLSNEYAQLVAQLSDALTDRDESDRHVEASKLDIDRLQRDNVILGNQLRDLGRQVRSLMRAIASSEIPGINERTGPEEMDEEEEEIRKRATESNDTDAVVSAHLVTFRTINDLQIQNQKLLRITREMGAQMEKAEEDTISRRRILENDAVEEAHELILKLKDEVENQRNKSEAFLRERDMLRRMLSSRSGGGDEESSVRIGGEGTSSDTARLLSETQSNFEAYKTEIALHSERLREDLAQAQRDANNARTDLAKQKAQSEFTAERFQILNNSYAQQTLELTQASKRTLQLQQALAKQDASTYKSSEELLSLRSNVDRLRHENTNFRSEQQVWKNVENRLIEENAALSRERSHLADLMGNLQTMQNELERAGNESRKRLEDQVSRLDQQVADLREKLSKEIDSGRQVALRKEFDARSYQERLDTLTSDHQITRENLMVAKTSQEHLEQRVSDLLLQITSKEEKLAIYEGRTSTNGVDVSQTREQQLEVIVADLRSELRATKSDLERASAHVEQFQAIAETQGESLRQLTATYDEYKTSTDATVAEKETEITSIRERLHSLTLEITAGQNVNSELHRHIEDERRTIEKERKTYEDALADLRAADVAAREGQLAAQDDSRRQAQLAKEASDKYQRELLDHAEDVKRFNVISNELDTIRSTVREHQLAEEVAIANLVASETSWNRQKLALEQEITDSKKRCIDLVAQNAVLHDHLESVGNQAKLQGRKSEGQEAEESNSLEADDDQLKEVIRYLRREKDISDLQLEFSKQELARVRQQHEYTSKTLEEVRKSLTELRQKSEESASSSAQHAELLERIHTAKVLRESNQTLRDENENNSRKLSQLDAQLQQVSAELEPLKEKAQTLQAEVDSKEHNIKLLQEDNERWKVRNQTILAKYERIDPEELQILKQEVIEAKSQLEKAQLEIKALEEAVAQQTKVAESMKQNWINSQERFKSLQTQARTTRDEKAAIAKELADLKTKLESGTVAPANAATQEETTRLLTRINTLEQEKSTLESKLGQQLVQLAEFEQKVTTITQEKAQLESTKEIEMQAIVARNDRLLKDNKKFITENKQHIANLAKLKADAEKNTIESSNPPTEIAATTIAVDGSTTLDQSSIDETVRLRVAAMESSLAARREAEIAAAITTATAQLQAELITLRQSLEEARASSNAATFDSSNFEIVKKELKLKFSQEKKELLERFEVEKSQLQAAAKKKELEITERLTAEIAKATASSTTLSTPVDIDSLVQAKLVSIDAERSAAQHKAIELAVAEISTKKDLEHETALNLAREQMANEATMKNKLLITKVARLEATVKQQKSLPAGATPNVPTNTTTSNPLPPLVASVTPTAGSSIRGSGGPPSRRGGATLPTVRGAVAGLALKGAARGVRGGRGGVLATLTGVAPETGVSSAPKRGREEGEATAGPLGDLSKRMKGTEETK